MILDEAQNIKNSSSVRWKTLLGFQCRNRLLLTGTPIQNSMQGSLTVFISVDTDPSDTLSLRVVGPLTFHHAQSV